MKTCEEVPTPGDLCKVTAPMEALQIATASGGEQFITKSVILEEGDVFLILSANEIYEITQWEFDIMHKSCTYYINIPADQSMIHIDGERGHYSFPFRAVKEFDKCDRRGGDTCDHFEHEDKKVPPLSLAAAPKRS